MNKLIESVTKWLLKSAPITKLSVYVLLGCFLYSFLQLVLPPIILVAIIGFWVSVLGFMSLGVLGIHLVLGPVKLFKPLYNYLYRLTGNEFYKDPFNYEPLAEKSDV